MKGAAAPIVGLVLVAALGGAIFVVPRYNADRLVAGARTDEFLQRARRMLLEYDPQLNFESEMRTVLGVEDFELTAEPGVERKYQDQLNKNAKFLQSALNEVNQALNVSVGSVCMRQDGAANRLRGMILYEQGAASAQRVSIIRGELAALRTSLQRRAQAMLALRSELDLVAASGIEERIAESQARFAAIEQERATQEQIAGTLQDRVGRMSRELESTREQGDDVRARMEELQDSGADLTHTGGVAEFERVYREVADRHRYLVTEAQVLEFGSLENAATDDPATGKYEPIIAEQGIGYRRGLLHYQQDLEAAQATLATLALAVDLARGNIAELEAMKNALTQRAAAAEAAIAAAVAAVESGRPDQAREGEEEAAAGGELETLLALNEEVRTLEEEGIKKFDEAARAFQTAAAGVPADARDVPASADQRLKDPRPAQGHIRAQQAEALLRAALLLVGQYQDLQSNVATLRVLGDFFNEQQQLAEWQEQAQQIRENAEGQIREAIELLEKAKDEIGGGNWIVAAEIGSAHYALGLVEVEMAAETALEWYRVALEERETQAFASDHVRMRDYIQSRADGQSP